MREERQRTIDTIAEMRSCLAVHLLAACLQHADVLECMQLPLDQLQREEACQ